MDNLENIIETMIRQHRTLQKDLGVAVDLANEGIPNTETIDITLKQFLADLSEHLQLEGGIFYPELLKKMKASGVETIKTEDFINQMKAIGEVVMTFLNKYNTADKIKDGIESFRKELVNIVSALNMRIELEEGGVYSYWEMYK